MLITILGSFWDWLATCPWSMSLGEGVDPFYKVLLENWRIMSSLVCIWTIDLLKDRTSMNSEASNSNNWVTNINKISSVFKLPLSIWKSGTLNL